MKKQNTYLWDFEQRYTGQLIVVAFSSIEFISSLSSSIEIEDETLIIYKKDHQVLYANKVNITILTFSFTSSSGSESSESVVLSWSKSPIVNFFHRIYFSRQLSHMASVAVTRLRCSMDTKILSKTVDKRRMVVLRIVRLQATHSGRFVCGILNMNFDNSARHTLLVFTIHKRN